MTNHGELKVWGVSQTPLVVTKEHIKNAVTPVTSIHIAVMRWRQRKDHQPHSSLWQQQQWKRRLALLSIQMGRKVRHDPS